MAYTSTTLSICTVNGVSGALTLLAAGTCTIAGNQPGNGTYAAAPQVTQNVTVGLGTATCTFTPYNVTFDGSAHTATGVCTGIGGVALSGLVLAGTTNTNAGDYATDAWTFSNADYTSQNGTVHDVITKATATCTVTPYNVTFDGSEHTAEGVCTPVVDAAPSGAIPSAVGLSGLDLSLTTHTVAGDYATDAWTFTNADYASQSGTLHNVITAVPTLTITANDQTRVFGAADPAFAYVLSAAVSLETTPTCTSTATASSPVGTYPITCTGAALAGYDISYVAGTLDITKAAATCTVTPYNVTFDGSEHTAEGVCTPVVDAAPSGAIPSAVGLSGLDLSLTTHTVAGDYATDAWTFTNADYASQSGTLHNVITAVPTLTITADNKTRVFGAADPAFTYVVSPSVSLVAPATCTSTAIASSPTGTYPISCTDAVVAGYTISYVAGTLTITGTEIVGGATATPTVAPTPTPVEQVGGATGTPVHAVTLPPTSSNGGSSNNDSLPLMFILIALAFGGLGLLAAQAQRRTIRL